MSDVLIPSQFGLYVAEALQSPPPPPRQFDFADSRYQRRKLTRLTDAQVDELRARYAAGMTRAALAREYGIAPSTVSRHLALACVA